MLSSLSISAVTISCPAKINWFLDVCPPRPNGYHPLQTVMQSIDLCDRIECSPRRDGRIVCVDPAQACCCPPDSTTVARAATLLKEACRVSAGATLTIHKTIPVGAGLGGGSSDAAAAFTALSRLWQCRIPLNDLQSLALQVGADVPFFLGSPAACCSGIGELLNPLDPVVFHIVLWKPEASLSTAAVYTRFDQALRPHRDPDDFISAYASRNPAAIADHIWNNLALAAMECLPSLPAMLTTALDAGARAAWITGSGPTIVCLCDDEQSARRLHVALTSQASRGDFLYRGTTIANALPLDQL